MRIEVNGTQIYFDVEGTGLEIGDGQLKKKPTLIALHGGPGFDHGYLRPGLGPLRDHAVGAAVDAQILLDGHLRSTVKRDRLQRVFLGDGHRLDAAVDGSAGGGEYQLSATAPTHGFQQYQRAFYIGL